MYVTRHLNGSRAISIDLVERRERGDHSLPARARQLRGRRPGRRLPLRHGRPGELSAAGWAQRWMGGASHTRRVSLSEGASDGRGVCCCRPHWCARCVCVCVCVGVRGVIVCVRGVCVCRCPPLARLVRGGGAAASRRCVRPEEGRAYLESSSP